VARTHLVVPRPGRQHRRRRGEEWQRPQREASKDNDGRELEAGLSMALVLADTFWTSPHPGIGRAMPTHRCAAGSPWLRPRAGARRQATARTGSAAMRGPSTWRATRCQITNSRRGGAFITRHTRIWKALCPTRRGTLLRHCVELLGAPVPLRHEPAVLCVDLVREW
jgi:hypothetical protein